MWARASLGRRPSKVTHGGGPFNRPTDIALTPSGEMFITDGYGNARVHKFSPDGKLLFLWGEPGTGPGQFNLPHGIALDKSGRVYVADRENGRVQRFDRRGKRTDEMLDIMLPLLDGETVTYHGRYYSVDDVFIEPRTGVRPALWVGGGSQLANPKSPDVPKFVESVKASYPYYYVRLLGGLLYLGGMVIMAWNVAKTIAGGNRAVQIMMINILLSGDNAVVIALAVRSLPERQRRQGILWGALAAVGMRVAIVDHQRGSIGLHCQRLAQCVFGRFRAKTERSNFAGTEALF